jgi:16S rRNA (guanine527-N7)-methyltransferase
MDPHRIAELLAPFTGAQKLSAALLEQLQIYLDLLLKWNARVNLTAVRKPEQIVTRHFGESLFAAKLLFGDVRPPENLERVSQAESSATQASITLADVGSGAGFPGVPIKLWAPHIQLTLIESHNKRATFLRELLRTLKLEQAQVFCGRAEDWKDTADVVTSRAVEKFEHALPVAAGVVRDGGELCLLVGSGQMQLARNLAGERWHWRDPVPIPLSAERVVLTAKRRAC